MTIALAVIVLILAHRYGPRHRRTAGDIIRDNQRRRPVRAWREHE